MSTRVSTWGPRTPRPGSSTPPSPSSPKSCDSIPDSGKPAKASTPAANSSALLDRDPHHVRRLPVDRNGQVRLPSAAEIQRERDVHLVQTGVLPLRPGV